MNADKRAYKTLGNRGLFDMEENKSKLTSLGNLLERLQKAVDFEMFRETLETGLYKNRMTNAGARPYDPVLMFKVLVLQRMYNWVVGFARNAARNTLTNLVYNVCRYEQVERLGMN